MLYNIWTLEFQIQWKFGMDFDYRFVYNPRFLIEKLNIENAHFDDKL